MAETTLRLKDLMKHFNIETKQTIFQQVEDILKDHFDLRYNVIIQRIEYKLKDQQEYKVLSERSFNTLFCLIGKSDIECNLSTFYAIVNSEFIENYDPFEDYFQSLDNKWDGKTDYIAQLVATIDTTNNELFYRYFKRYLVSAVACALGKSVNHQVIVLSGPQGQGKSSAIKNLTPNSLQSYRYSGTLDLKSKDSQIILGQALFIDLDELENLTKSEAGSLKSLITRSIIKVRPPYGRFYQDIVRRSSFIGSINENEFLTDLTGNRRYLCFTIKSINNKHQINMDDVYAQAYQLLTKGENGEPFKHWFDKNDFEEIEENNSNYVRLSYEEELITKYLTAPTAETDRNKIVYYSPTEIISYINQYQGRICLDQRNYKKMGQVLHKLGFTKKSDQKSKRYGVVLLIEDLERKHRKDKEQLDLLLSQ